MNWRVISACATLLAVLGPVPTAAASDSGAGVQVPRPSDLRVERAGRPRLDDGHHQRLRARLAALRGRCRERQDGRRHRLPGAGDRRRGARPRGWVGGLGRRHRRQPGAPEVRDGLPGRRGCGEARVRAPAYRLVYPKRRSHDAESLFADRQGRLYVVTKTFFGGTVYRAPLRLSRSRANRLQPVGRVREFATDAALMRDGRHLLVRGYDSAGVYTFPGLRRVGDFTLPAQRQGEGISVGPGNRIRLSSEGVHSVVQQVPLPSALAPVVSPPPTPSSSRRPRRRRPPRR